MFNSCLCWLVHKRACSDKLHTQGVFLASDFGGKERLKQKHIRINLWSCYCAGLARVTHLQQWLVAAVGGEGCFWGEGWVCANAWKKSWVEVFWCPEFPDSGAIVWGWSNTECSSFLASCYLVKNVWLVTPGAAGSEEGWEVRFG